MSNINETMGELAEIVDETFDEIEGELECLRAGFESHTARIAELEARLEKAERYIVDYDGILAERRDWLTELENAK